jgi:hypothetical protein
MNVTPAMWLTASLIVIFLCLFVMGQDDLGRFELPLRFFALLFLVLGALVFAVSFAHTVFPS